MDVESLIPTKTLPAQPAGYVEIAPGKLVPYYNKS
jgi:hypothetical protein